MFVIKPINPSDWEIAIFMLSYYHVQLTIRSNGEQASTTYIVVEKMLNDGDDKQAADDLRTAEMCFQMNWHTHSSKLCPDCIDHADVFDSCGHLTFSKPIKPAF